jgi:protein-L-isoaspartate(D-aspartate) O-methyltransferase
LGWPEHAPYDGIVVAAGGPQIPLSLRQQLAPGGRMVIPVGRHRERQQLVRITRENEGDFRQEKLGHVRFVPLIGREGWRRRP